MCVGVIEGEKKRVCVRANASERVREREGKRKDRRN